MGRPRRPRRPESPYRIPNQGKEPRSSRLAGCLVDHRNHQIEDDYHDEAGQVDHPGAREDPSHRLQQWLCELVQELDEPAPGVDGKPRNQRPNDDGEDQDVEKRCEDQRDLMIQAEPPSSRARWCAAWMHSMMAALTAPRSSWKRPAAVVPAGDVTLARSSAALRPVSWA